jgi:hypothetical protein
VNCSMVRSVMLKVKSDQVRATAPGQWPVRMMHPSRRH